MKNYRTQSSGVLKANGNKFGKQPHNDSNIFK